MRLHPLASACLAILLCVTVTSCAGHRTDGGDSDTPTEAASDPGSEEADESGSPSAEPEQEWPFGTPVGWAAQPGPVETAPESDEADRSDEGGAPNGEDGAEDEDSDDSSAQESSGPTEHPGVTGGADGDTVGATDADTLVEHLSSDEPLVVEVEGDIDLDGTIHVGSDKTLLGVGEGAELTKGRLVVDGSTNVIIANVTMDVDATAISVQGGAHHVWVDGSTFSGGDGDSLVSVTDGADHVTLSWNRFTDAEAAIGIGADDDAPGALRVSVHHNFFDGTTSRHPRARNAEHVHVFNNYFRDNPDYGVRSAHGSNVLVEGNYFERTPLSVSTQDDEPGNVVTRDNLLVDSDQPDLRGEVPEPPYVYELDDTVSVPDLVGGRAGAL